MNGVRNMAQNAPLSAINDWPQRAHAANYCVKALAQNCSVSARRLERFFAIAFGKPPHKWLHELRMQRAMGHMLDCTPVKEAAYLLGYKDATHLNHDFKNYFGIPPGKAVATGLSALNPFQMSLFDRRCRV